MNSQRTVYELTQELDDAHSMLSIKEADCTRLARELGSSQVREAQEKARVNQELRKVVQEQEFKFSQKNEEVNIYIITKNIFFVFITKNIFSFNFGKSRAM